MLLPIADWTSIGLLIVGFPIGVAKLFMLPPAVPNGHDGEMTRLKHLGSAVPRPLHMHNS